MESTVRVLGNPACKLLIGAVIGVFFAYGVEAQVQTQTNVEHGPATQTVNVERGEVITVSGNDLVVKMADGEIREFPDVPDSAKITVDGKELTVRDLKPGMKLERTTVVTSKPRMVTTTRTVTGRIFHITPPNSVILTLEDNTNQRFTIPQGTTFMIDGRPTNVRGLRRGMTVTATAITESPEIVSSREVKRTGTMPPPPAPPAAGVPILVIVSAPTPATEAVAEAGPPAKLPKTASELPLVGSLGLLLCALGFAVKAIRLALSPKTTVGASRP